jgi:hypothetical protein
MNRRTVGYTVLGLFVLTLAFAGLAAADDPILDPNEPPVRLKKKKGRDADKAVDKKSEPRKDGEDQEDRHKKKDADKGDKDKPPLPENEVDAKEEREQLINRMLKKMETVEERLAKNDPGLSTREMQRDILKDLDALIEQTKQQPPPKGSRSRQSSRSSKNSKNSKTSKNSKNSKNSGNPNSKNSRDKSGSKKDKGRGKSQSGRQGKKDGGGQGGGGDKNAKNKKNKLADLYKEVWGEWPKTLRMEMDAYSRAKYIREYEALLKQYYRTISEEDRSKKGD